MSTLRPQAREEKPTTRTNPLLYVVSAALNVGVWVVMVKFFPGFLTGYLVWVALGLISAVVLIALVFLLG